jgi:hypothetical protein
MIDYYGGTGISISKDDAKTFSKVDPMFTYGRHHPSIVLLDNDDIIMSYAVRAGYPKDANDFAQFGEEAVVSKDNGRSWDLDHRYILHKWSAGEKGDAYGYAAQASSTIILPDGDLLTAYGREYRKACVVRWRPVSE